MKKIHFITLIGIVLIASSFKVSAPASTSLRIAVLDNLGNIIEGATVTLYSSAENYRNETNPVTEPRLTDAKGIVKFKKIQAVKYFIYVTKDDMNNIGNGVESDSLEEGKVNRITIVIE